MKQLHLHFSDHNDIAVIVVNLGAKFQIDGLEHNDNFIFVVGPRSFYKQIKLLADLSHEYSEPSWDVIDYGFPLQRFEHFKQLIEAAV
jgi:hypothetical protein